MHECFRCGISEKEANLNKVISNVDGVTYICDSCLEFSEDMPIVKPKDPSKPIPGQTVYERLARASRLNPIEHKRNSYNPERQKLIEKEDGQLKQVINKSIHEQKKRVSPRVDLIDNFRWIIVRQRRSRKISQEQLAETIMEPISSIKLAEEGIIAEWDDKLVDKLERFFRTRLRRNSSERHSMSEAKEAMLKEISKGNLSFTPEVARNFTIEDLRKLKEHGVEMSEEELTKLQSEQETQEEKKPGFFSKLFSKFKRKKKEESDEIQLEEGSAEIPEDEIEEIELKKK